MNVPPDESSRGFSPMAIGGVILGALLLLLLIPTFRSPAPPPGDAPGNGEPAGDDVSQSQCERTLMSAIDGLQPNRLGLSSEVRVMVDTLNNWSTQCVDLSLPIVDQSDQPLREQLLTEAGFAHSQSERYQLRDAEQIRNSLLAAAVVDRITTDLRSDQQRALALFYYVVRTLELLPDDAPELLLTPYESLVYGLGTASDRGWTYALLMRQLRLDVVMIQPRAREETTYWLLGAIIPGEGVLLLDPRMGLPISTAADLENPQGPLPETAATLADVRQSDRLLRQYDQGDRKYPLTAEDLQTVDVYAIGTSSTFAPRMGRLQAALPEVGEVFDGLASSELREVGLIERLANAGKDGLWTRDQVHVLPDPEQLWSNVDEPTPQQQQRLDNLQAVLSGPLVVEITVAVNDEDQLRLGTRVEKPQRSLLEARIEQLLGNFADAQQAYLRARLNKAKLTEVQAYFKLVHEAITEQIKNPQEVQQTFLAIQQQVVQQINNLVQATPQRQLNILAADRATFWAAQAQYEQHDYRVAAESAMAYGKRGVGEFLMPAFYLASLSLAQDGRPAEAVALADQLPTRAAASLGYLALVDRWRKLAGESQKTDKQDADPDNDAGQKPAGKTDDASAETDKPQSFDNPQPAGADGDATPEVAPQADSTDGATSDKGGVAEDPAPAQDAEPETDPS